MRSQFRGPRLVTGEASTSARPAPRRESYPDCTPQSRHNPRSGRRHVAAEWTDSGDEYRYVITAHQEGGVA